MQKHQATLSSFQFKRATADLIHVLNEGSYLMAEYNERTGGVCWHRVLLASQRDAVEKWLRERFPIQVAPPAHKPVRAESDPAGRSGRNRAGLRHGKRSR